MYKVVEAYVDKNLDRKLGNLGAAYALILRFLPQRRITRHVVSLVLFGAPSGFGRS